jgi:hypothetical protein
MVIPLLPHVARIDYFAVKISIKRKDENSDIPATCISDGWGTWKAEFTFLLYSSSIKVLIYDPEPILTLEQIWINKGKRSTYSHLLQPSSLELRLSATAASDESFCGAIAGSFLGRTLSRR